MACAAAEHIEALGEGALLHGPEPHRMASVKAPHRTANAGLALWSVGRSWLLACLQKEQHRLLLLCRAVLWCCLAVACIAPSGSAVGPWGGHFALVTAAATGALTLCLSLMRRDASLLAAFLHADVVCLGIAVWVVGARRRLSRDGDCPWDASACPDWRKALRKVSLYAGVGALVPMAYLGLPLSRSSSLWRAAGRTYEESIGFHRAIGHGM
ncbi:hypothetical protein EMIHUDRAFT_353960, partial [Emiliania huxleyi CCMP1516]|uniref:Uncharacterized protein n=2 Tax=Emiliania huxleyi TaxID=2903 RepID=A0A0D3JSR9_EMIH1